MKTKTMAFGFLLVASISAAQAPDSTTLVAVGQTVPQFSISTLDGKTVRMPDLNRHPVLLTFFATWCPACNMEMPELETQIWKKYRTKGLMVLALGREQSAKEIKAFLEEKNFSFPAASDPKRAVFRLFATQNIPRNVLVDRDGTIVYLSVGYDPESFNKLITAIDGVLAK
jgi:peroxiredoxin